MLSTYSKFIYGFEVISTNKYFSIGDGVTDYEVELDEGSYTPNELLTEIKEKVLEQATLTIDGSISYQNQTYTFTSASNFDLNITSGNANSVFTLLGFTGADVTGVTTATSNETFGSVFKPQVLLQGYVPFEHNKNLLFPSVNKTVSGDTQLIYFGDESYMTCDVRYQTDIRQPSGSLIEDQANGLQNLLSFLNYAIKKNKILFYPDRDGSTVYTCLLDSIAGNKNATGYRLREYLGKMNGYYTTGQLIFRRI